ncbi:uncharacterized protein G2W53_019895 [Senna tora]|uniref:Uncharacterized protein n=1 Tax=Senna tora TaxID=362788 RepID=A0A834TYP1_9FABA|nr:uncharacterized protein G2W53_019895 [Senna tora]
MVCASGRKGCVKLNVDAAFDSSMLLFLLEIMTHEGILLTGRCCKNNSLAVKEAIYALPALGIRLTSYTSCIYTDSNPLFAYSYIFCAWDKRWSCCTSGEESNPNPNSMQALSSSTSSSVTLLLRRFFQFPFRRSHASSRSASGDHDFCLYSGAWASDMGGKVKDPEHSPCGVGLCGGRGTSHAGLENAMAYGLF